VEHDLSENRSPLFRIMLMDGRFARPRFSFACAWKRGGQRERDAASLLPHSASKTRVNALMGEKDRMRGFGPRSLILNLPNPLTPTLSPLWRGSPLREPPRTFMARASVLAARLGARVFRRANCELRARAYCCHFKCETGPVQGKGRGGCLPFVRPLRQFRPIKLQELK
jgi:hypothetical protein